MCLLVVLWIVASFLAHSAKGAEDATYRHIATNFQFNAIRNALVTNNSGYLINVNATGNNQRSLQPGATTNYLLGVAVQVNGTTQTSPGQGSATFPDISMTFFRQGVAGVYGETQIPGFSFEAVCNYGTVPYVTSYTFNPPITISINPNGEIVVLDQAREDRVDEEPEQPNREEQTLMLNNTTDQEQKVLWGDEVLTLSPV